DDGNVSRFGAARTHGGKGLVTRRIQEGDLLACCGSDLVGANMLRNATGFTGDHVGAADIVQQRGLTMVYVTHDGDHRGTRQHVFRIVHFLFLFHFSRIVDPDELDGITEFPGHELDDIGLQTLIDRYHHPQAHALADHIGVADIHQIGQFAYTDEFGDLETAVHRFIPAGLFGHLFPFGPAVFGFQAFPATAGACQLRLGLPDLFLYLFLVDLFCFAGCVTGIGSAVAASMTCATGTAAIGVPLQRGTLMSAGTLIPALVSSILAAARASLTRSSAAPGAMVLFLDGDPFALSFFFRWLFGTGFAARGQIDLAEDLRAFDLFCPDIFDDGRRLLFVRARGFGNISDPISSSLARLFFCAYTRFVLSRRCLFGALFLCLGRLFFTRLFRTFFGSGGRIDRGKVYLADHFGAFQLGCLHPHDFGLLADGFLRYRRRLLFHNGRGRRLFFFFCRLLYNGDLFRFEQRLRLLLDLFLFFLLRLQAALGQVDLVGFHLGDPISLEFLLQ